MTHQAKEARQAGGLTASEARESGVNVPASEGGVGFTAAQIRAMRWLADMPNTRASWRSAGDRPAKGPPSAWTHMKLEGDEGSILIESSVWKSLHDFIAVVPSARQQFGLNDEGREVLAKAKGA